MDASRFDRYTKILAASRSRRSAMTALFGSAVALVSLHGPEPPDTVAASRKVRRQRQKHKGDGVTTQGPCGNGGPKHNRCKRHGHCCTGYCRKRRCRCRKPGDSCDEDRNCCPDRTGRTCQDGACQSAPSCAGPGAVCSSDLPCCAGLACGADARCEAISACPGGCDDGNPCTIDECDPGEARCTYTSAPDGTPCPSGPNAIGVCVSGGACQITCNAGFADCDGNPATGCETNLLTDPLNCGACGNNCGICSNGMPGACVAGTCQCDELLG